MMRKAKPIVIVLIIAAVCAGFYSYLVAPGKITSVNPGVAAFPYSGKGCNGACTLGSCIPDPGYDWCYDYRYGDAYVKVQTTELNTYSGTNDIIRGLVQKYAVSGSGTVSAYFNTHLPKCDSSGCNEIPMPNSGEVIYGVYDVYVPGTSTLSTQKIGDGGKLKLTSGGVYLLWPKTQPNYIYTGHSYSNGYWCYAYIGWGEDVSGSVFNVKSALVPESITTSPSNPAVGDTVTITVNLKNYCKYRAAQLFTVTTYDSSGNVYHPPVKDELWMDGDSSGTVTLPEGYIFNKPGTFIIELKSPDGETWTKSITVGTPAGQIEIYSIQGYILTGAGLAVLAYLLRRGWL